MKRINDILQHNKQWALENQAKDPKFFQRYHNFQDPEYLWIACSDSRIPTNDITGLGMGEIFVHRNIANLATTDDLNCMAALQYAVHSLKVRHIIVCGHDNCGGIRAAFHQPDDALDLTGKWLYEVRRVYRKHSKEILSYSQRDEQEHRLAELNVIEQVLNIGHSRIIQEAWQKQEAIHIHGFIYSLHDGLLKDLEANLSSTEDLQKLRSEYSR